MTRHEAGLLGEWRAARFLKKQGMKLLRMRYRCAQGEIDLLLREGNTLVLAEVKYRPNGALGAGVSAVTAEKQRRIRRAAAHYLREHPATDVRFDVVEIGAAGVRHIKNAF